MKFDKKLKTSFIFSLIFIFLMSLTFLIMPFASMRALVGNKLMLQITGIWFWVSLVIGYALFLKVSKGIKKIRKRQHNRLPKEGPGIIRFFTNRWAVIADLTNIVSVSGLLITARLIPLSYVVSIFLAIVIFSFQMHCILNGRNFNYIINN